MKLQRGIVLPLVAIALVAIIAMVGLAIDLGHAYFNKTRLQNATDAAALSAAVVLNNSSSIATASSGGTTTFNDNLGASGNSELSGETVAFTYADALAGPYGAGSLTSKYVKATASTLPFASYLVRVLPGFASLSVGATAIAGPSPPLQQICDVVPVVACDTPSYPSSSSSYVVGQTYTLSHASNSTQVPSFYDTLAFGSTSSTSCSITGSSDNSTNTLRAMLAGCYSQCVDLGHPCPVDPGSSPTPISDGINTRFTASRYSCPHGGITPPPDVYTATTNYAGYSAWYQNSANASAILANQAGVDRRIITVPMGDCSAVHSGSNQSITITHYGCFFLQQPSSGGAVTGEFIGLCDANGTPGTGGTGGVGKSYTIQLY